MNGAVTSNSTMIRNRYIGRVSTRAVRGSRINIQGSNADDDPAGKWSLGPFSAGCDGLHQIVRDLGGVVTRHSVLFQVVTQHRYDTERLDGIEIVLDLARTLQCVF